MNKMQMISVCGTPVALAPRQSLSSPHRGSRVIQCSSRPQKKATSHHMKTRPKKTQPWDIKRKPTVYAPLPKLPPDWTLLTPSDESSPSSYIQPDNPTSG